MIGQGFIGRNMADDFSERGFEVVRYSLDPEYLVNREKLSDCDVVFIAVPTPTTNQGCDVCAVREVLSLVGEGRVAVIKSTIVPGTTRKLQEEFPLISIMHSPEFLRERYAKQDTQNPPRNIIGIPKLDDESRQLAEAILKILPPSPYERICQAEEAELAKYGGNIFLAMKVVYMNLIYELAESYNTSYDVIAELMSKDDRIGQSHMKVIDASGHTSFSGRGAGGHCFPKDLAALRMLYEEKIKHDPVGQSFLRSLEDKNKDLLISTKKDLDLLRAIYGDIGS